MKKKTSSISHIRQVNTVDIDKSILLPKEQLKIKGGASPWLEGP